jgi:Sugar (and other) transporter
VTHDQLILDVEQFAKEHQLVELTPMLLKGAQVAKDPPAFESVEGLTEGEKEAIRNEVLHKWRQPKQLFFTIILCSIGAAVQGWDQTGSNGANLSFPVAFNISDAETLPDGSPNPDRDTNLWLVGLINAAPYIASAFLGCWMSDPLNNYFGRRGTIFFSAAFCCLSVIGSAVTQNWWQLFITRILLGIGMGSKASTVPIFCAENAPASVRGGLVMCWQVSGLLTFLGEQMLIRALDVDSIW